MRYYINLQFGTKNVEFLQFQGRFAYQSLTLVFLISLNICNLRKND